MLRWARRCVQTISSWNFTCPVAFFRPRAKGNCFRAGAGSLQWTSASAVNLNPLTAGPDLAGSDSLSAPCRGGAAGGGAAAGAGPPTPITGRWLISYFRQIPRIPERNKGKEKEKERGRKRKGTAKGKGGGRKGDKLGNNTSI